MVAIHIVYQGELRCALSHEPSGTVIYTDAPKDNHGKGESFSPTDLVAAALGGCMLTIMGIAARKLGISIDGTKVSVVKEMVATPVRRIGALKVVIDVPTAGLDDTQKKCWNMRHSRALCMRACTPMLRGQRNFAGCNAYTW